MPNQEQQQFNPNNLTKKYNQKPNETKSAEICETDSVESTSTKVVNKESEVTGVAKKKGTRKKRSLNWEEGERALLLETLKLKVEYVENRNVDAKSIKAKRLAWMQITKQFNALNFRHRSLEQIQVQWRSMKNTAKREYQLKNAKPGTLEAREMVEFMEQMQKEVINGRGHLRAAGGGGGNINRKAGIEINNDDEDTPLSDLPASATNASADIVQTSPITALSSPPLSDSLNDKLTTTTTTSTATATTVHVMPRERKKYTSINNCQYSPLEQRRGKMKKARNNNSIVPSDAATSITSEDATISILQQANCSPIPEAEENKYKKKLYDLLRSSRVAEMDYARREHEQKIRLEEMAQDVKLNYCRQQEELKLRQMSEEHELRMRHLQIEHDIRMKVYMSAFSRKNTNSKYEMKDNIVYMQ